MTGFAAVLVAFLTASSVQAPGFSFGGVGLDSDLDQIATRYPHSTRTSGYISVAPEDSNDHISGIEISGAGPARRVRISFETRHAGRPPDYPTCAEVQKELEQQFGRPDSTRKYSEETSQREDHLWLSRTEGLTLLCFAGPGGSSFAEAVQINPR